jgi:formimidoylglutamate deiminase
MTRQYQLASVLLPQGWTQNALITVAEDGYISAIQHSGAPPRDLSTSGPAAPSAAAAPEQIDGIVVPGMPNGHSHAFQRGMNGNTEYRLSSRDSFWTWRQAMYTLANRIQPADLQILATQLFIEMLKAGYTSVAEFHYLHRPPDGGQYPGDNALWAATAEAAAVTGIGLTFLPTLYQTSDFGAQPLKKEQARFATDTEYFLRAVEHRLDAERRGAPATRRTGVAFHSLRAVPLDTLRHVAQALRVMDPTLPLHIHVSEQIKEVEACMAHTGRRPIELLLDTGLLDEHWCLVHATHANLAEMKGMAASNAVVCLAITTEANLGDGFFDAARFLKYGGRLCVGSDSQATVSPAEELRWMEYQQRLRKRRRGVLADARESHAGTRLWRDAALHGAQALGQRTGEISIGHRADWLVLDRDHPTMVGAPVENALDHVVFAGGDAAIRDVMVGGRWVVKARHHAAEVPLQGEFSQLMHRLASAP